MAAVFLLRVECVVFLAALTALLFYRSLTGRMALTGLLSGRVDGRGVSAERVQLLITTLAVSVQYLRSVAHSHGAALPDVSTQTLFLFGGSGSIYAVAKAARLWLSGKP